MIEVIHGDCLKALKAITDKHINAFVTSPPYNLDIKYNEYKDNKKRNDYLSWLFDVFTEVKRTMKDDGSLFLNIGSSNIDPWIPMDVAMSLRKLFVLQNDIIWVKSISIKKDTVGHFKPINSKRFLNHTHEKIFHFTKSGKIPIDRKAIGVPFKYKSNIARWKNNKDDLRCKGNVWFIPYDTIQKKSDKGEHPAVFPEKLVEDCIKLHGYNDKTLICDPFVGTGTTAVVAKKLGINCIAIELDKFYVDFTNGRLENIS